MIAAAIFAKDGATVTEAYSAFEQPLRRFSDAAGLVAYMAGMRHEPAGVAHLAVVYADMAGALVEKTVVLDPAKCQGMQYRQVAEGWGVIRLYLKLGQVKGPASFVSANSAGRAAKWAPLYPELPPPDSWNWPAVASHERRLARVLKKALTGAIDVSGTLQAASLALTAPR